MSKNRTTETRTRVLALLGTAIAVAVLVAVGLLLREHGPGNMGNGFLQGGLVALIVFGVVMWRVTTRPDRASTFERAFTQTGDERDDAVLTRAFAVMGATALPLTGAAAITIALGAETPMILTFLLVAHALVGTVAFVVINRRS